MNVRVVFSLGLSGVIALGATLTAQHLEFPIGEHVIVHARHDIVRHTGKHVGHVASVEQSANEDLCRDTGSDNENYRSCEVREYTVSAGALSVDAGRNGGIRVEAWDRNEIRVRAVVTATAASEAEAKQLASQVHVQAGPGRVSSTGPATNGREWWSVSYRINVPARNDLDLNANNGGVSIAGVTGTIKFETTNGGVNLTNLAGDVRGETRNGGLNVVLRGDRWDGSGLDVQTSNGGVNLTIPEGYNAELETRTVNGGFRTDYPITVQGELSANRGFQTTLGSGGAPVRVRTTNGGLRLNKP